MLLDNGDRLDLASLRKGYSFAGIELITLSACDTAVGGDGNGAEVDGLALTVQKNGAKGVLASLRPVADVSSRKLMQLYYRLRQSEDGLTKAEALRRAQLALLRGLDAPTRTTGKRGGSAGEIAEDEATESDALPFEASAPNAYTYYRAPFVLVGNWL